MTYTVLDTLRRQRSDDLREHFALDVLMGFSAENKFLPSKYFYDARGSELFARITDLQEYYPTQCEFEILSRLGGEISEHFPTEPFDIVELGAGDGRKTKVLLSGLLQAGREFTYIPVDISATAVLDLTRSLERSEPALEVQGIVGDYLDSLRHLDGVSERRKLLLFLGSNIGNFDYINALRFLRNVWKRLAHGDMLLIGFDLKKDVDVLLRAYNDARGVTRAFNLNVLRRINSELQGEFDLEQFDHYGLYNPLRGAMESYLLSLREQEVCVGEIRKKFSFRPFEAIHLEYSYKYLPPDIENMAAATGFSVLGHWQDSRNWFMDSLWRVQKDR